MITSEPKLFVNASHSYWGDYNKQIFDFKETMSKWIFIKCDTGFDRKVIHQICDGINACDSDYFLHHQTIRINIKVHQKDYHQKYENWT